MTIKEFVGLAKENKLMFSFYYDGQEVIGLKIIAIDEDNSRHEISQNFKASEIVSMQDDAISIAAQVIIEKLKLKK